MHIDEKIGILLVHGIGEQRRFEHLEAEVRNFAAAIAARRGGMTEARATVEIARGPCSAFGADHETWRSDHVPPVKVIVREGSRVTCVCFHEVWWADLGARPGFRSLLAFWLWALGMWAAVGRDGPPPCGLDEQMRLPGALDSDLRWRSAICRRQAVHVLARFQLFAVATFFLVATGSVTLVNLALRKLGFARLPGAAALVNFLGDVMVFRRPTPMENGPITDLGHPPRAAIRRRMVAALVDMATARYDRWYIVAHSLGSVVAFNGLTDTAHCLPNYLDERRWRRLVRLGMAGPGEEGRDWPERQPGEAKVPPVHNMLPRRPVWLDDADTIHRDRLFADLRGFLTYGSPLDKFAALWPGLVPLNKVQAVFPPACEWINVYDPTDPVGGRLDEFAPIPPLEAAVAGRDLRPLRVKNFGYRASPWLLVSHIRYLRPGRRGRGGCLVDAVAQWVLEGGRFRVPSGSRRWFAPEPVEDLANKAALLRLVGRSAWRWLQWGILGCLVTALTALVLRGVPWVLPTWLTEDMAPYLPLNARHGRGGRKLGDLRAVLNECCDRFRRRGGGLLHLRRSSNATACAWPRPGNARGARSDNRPGALPATGRVKRMPWTTPPGAP